MDSPTEPDRNALLLLGGGGHCRSVIDVLEQAGQPIAGVVHGRDAPFEAVCGYPPLGRDEELERLHERFSVALVTVGQIKSPDVRQRLYERLVRLGFVTPMVASPLAWISPRATVGPGSIVMHQALINAGASVGENCIINTKALLEHDCVVDSHCHVAVGAIVCGDVCVGEGSFIGAGAVIRQGLRIGRGVVIGCGATVLRDVPDHTLIKGHHHELLLHHR